LLRTFSYVHTLGHAAELRRGLDGVGLAVDTGHLWWDPALTSDFTEHVDQVVTVQVTDVSTEALAAYRYERAAPETGEVPLARLLRTFRDAGYQGFYETAVLVRVPKEERSRMLRDTLAWLERTWNDLVCADDT
jgi:sugar phosphate isomerase/epimerase